MKSSTSAATAALLTALLLTSTVGAVEPGEVPPAIDLPDRKGVEVDLSELAGKVVVVDFWASWCGPCRKEMPLLQTFHEKYAKEGLVIVGVNLDRSAKKMNAFLEKTPVTFRIVHDPKAEVAQRYAPRAMPTSYFIGRDGKLRYVHEGFTPDDAPLLETHIQALLGDTLPPENPNHSNPFQP